MMDKIKKILHFIHLMENLKDELRDGWTKSGRQESVAEHSWRIALMVILCHRYLDQKINLEKALKMAIIHDIVEAKTGDIPFFYTETNNSLKEKKIIAEKIAIKELSSLLPEDLGIEIHDLWNEFESNKSYEAKFVKALDKIEAQIQQNEADLSTWLQFELDYAIKGHINKFCFFDKFTNILGKEVIEESKQLAKQAKEKEIAFPRILKRIIK